MLKKILTLSFLLFFSIASFAQKKHKVILTTEYGNVIMELYDNTPQHRDNFIKLAKQHFYDGTLFHRVIPGFMIQGGDPDSKDAAPGAMLGSGDVGYKIPAEINSQNIHQRGALAAARDGNPEKASSGCQFYIVQGKKFSVEELKALEERSGTTFTPRQMRVYENIGGAPHLDGNYTVFGRVVEGMNIVDKIAAQSRNQFDRPDTDQKILKLRVKKKFLFLWL